ncbi:MAG: RIP metalloprotease RseP [Cyclobacteriaceae bacterium]
MEVILIKAAQLFLSLAILVTLHELGHFIPAKLFKTRVEKFYLFFDPWFSVVKKKIGGTEYGLGWLPLGGYVKIAGMIDESMDKEQLSKEPEDWEFRSKPAWQRLIIMIGGVTINVILAILIYAMTLGVWGETYLPNKNVKDGVWVMHPIMKKIGFQNGDKVLAIDDKPIENFSDIAPELFYGSVANVERNGEIVNLTIPKNFIEQLLDGNKKSGFFIPRTPFKVGDVVAGGNAAKGGLKKGDVITSVNDSPIKYFDQILSTLEQNKGQKVAVIVNREDKFDTLSIAVTDSGKIGFQAALYDFSDMERAGIYDFESRKYGFFSAIPAGFSKAYATLGSYVKQFKVILNPSTGAYKGVGGFAAIGGMFPPEWNWQIFWERTAFLSIILAFMNLLPIPALDGGHVMFLLYEMITGRKPHDKVLEYAQIVGMVLLFSLLIFANGNDIYRNFFK